MTLRIAGVGTAVPPHWIEQDEAADVAKSFAVLGRGQARLLETIYRRSDIERRHSVLLERPEGSVEERQDFFWRARGPEDRGPTTADRMRRYRREASELAVAAAARALEEAGDSGQAITHLVTASCTGFFAPGIDFVLLRELGLDPGVSRTHIGFMGCHAALNAIGVARAFTEADPAARVLVCAVELCTLHLRYGWDSETVVANSLFADGAGALVGVAGGADGDSGRGSRQEGRWSVVATGSYRLPDSDDAMGWRVGDHGFEMTLAARVPDLISRHTPAWLSRWLAGHGLSIDEVGSWAVHPGGPRILAALEKGAALGAGTLEVSRRVLARYGNMSSATILFILEELRRADAPRPCVALGFGPGMVVEAALLR